MPADHALIWAVHRTQNWWKHVGRHLGFARNTVVTDRRNIGNMWVSDDFYGAYRRLEAGTLRKLPFLSDAEIADVIARCRVLRWLPRLKAERMVHAMSEAVERLLDKAKPDTFLCFPIDNYVSDLIARAGRKRGVPTFEVTASAFPGMTMLMHRGRLIAVESPAREAQVAERIACMTESSFTPAYVGKDRRYGPAQIARTYAYFQARGLAFSTWSRLIRDPLRFHLLEARSDLGYKPRLRDLRIDRYINTDWRERITDTPRSRRVLFALQLIPEAAIDYWIEDLRLVEHEELLVEAANNLAAAGYQIIVKDHPLQFGFRQVELLDRLLALPGTVVVPYHVSGNEMIAECGVSLTATGTLGLQAAMIGNISIIGEAYYGTQEDFVTMRVWDDCASLAEQVDQFGREDKGDLAERQRRIIGRLSRGSFDADFSCWQRFRGGALDEAAAFGAALGERLRMLGPDGEDWHRRHMPPGGGRHAGSPLN